VQMKKNTDSSGNDYILVCHIKFYCYLILAQFVEINTDPYQYVEVLNCDKDVKVVYHVVNLFTLLYLMMLHQLLWLIQ
jgi:hypothetical protein